jgi:hypothetical protein
MSKSSKSWIVAVRSQSGDVIEMFEFEKKREATSFAASARKKWGFETAIARKENVPCKKA